MERKAWFLCKFLCRTLDEESYEKMRYHMSICRGVKTKVKLNEKGWSTGYKTTSLRHFGHKLPYELFPLAFVEDMHQDAMFVNVLLCVFRMQNLPDLQYEIVAYKFADNETVRKFQDIFQILTGGSDNRTLNAPGSSLTLVPGRSYHMGTLSPDRWGSRDRLANTGSVVPSEVKVTDTSRRQTNGRMVLDSEGSWSGASSYLDDNGTVFRTNDGTVVAPANGTMYSRPHNGITVTSVDSYDGPSSRRDHTMSSSLRKVYNRPPSDHDRTPDPVMTLNRSRYQSTDSSSYYGRSRSVDPYGGRSDLPSDRSDIYRPSDAMSVKSQSSYLLSPNFKKVYGKRTPQPGPAYMQGSYQNIPRSYNGNDMRRNGRW